MTVSKVQIKDPFIDTTSAHGKFVITLFGAIAQLERDIIIERTTAGLKSARRRGIQLGRKKGLNKVAKQKAILAATYYKENNLPIVDIMKLVGIKSKPTLYKYLAIQGRRNCKDCGAIFLGRGPRTGKRILQEAFQIEKLISK